ncbi:MAG: aminotransferase class I/II-fold pyridoxal phosphate-dependent enzyme [Cyanobacteria bacterium]|nr:aminotransferase class I/II-fold pyridoxal phosphate-dependent enzyme [Cyanobacteriota bacterium]
MKLPLIDAMNQYERLKRLRFTVPGHTGVDVIEKTLSIKIPGISQESYCFDQTEVEGLDVLSTPSECLRDTQQLAASIFGVAHSYFLVNGSTVGIEAAMLACLKPGDTVLVPRNVHRSVVSGMVLTGTIPHWVFPEWLESWGLWGALSAEAVRVAFLRDPHIKAVVLTSPTYEGVGSDIQAIAKVCQENQAFLLVDEAHGSLWPFSNQLPLSACHLGADVVVQSLHKSAGSLTQTALAHLPIGSKMSPDAFQEALNTLHTTSPSYLFLASLEASCAFLGSVAGQELIENFTKHLQGFRRQFAQDLRFFQLFQGPSSGEEDSSFDFTKLYVKTKLESGEHWAPRMELNRNLAYESTNGLGALYLPGLGLEEQDYRQFLEAFRAEEVAYRLKSAVEQLSQKGSLENPENNFIPPPQLPFPISKVTPREAFFLPGETIRAIDAIGRESKNTIVQCPPGVPCLLPGEIVQADHLPYLPQTITVLKGVDS